MKIKIRHETTYNYSSIVPQLIQSLKLFPSKCKNQKIINWKVYSDKGKVKDSHYDALGHKIVNIFNKKIIGKQKIISEGKVITKDYSGIMKDLNDKVNPLCFLKDTELTKSCEKIKKLNHLISNTNDQIKFCHSINLAVSESIKHVKGSTSTKTTAKKSIEQGQGVCQDFAHILISLARLNGFPARYINGFLLEDLNSQENSSHAWVEIFLKNLGWVGFDPSHKKCIDEKYVRISCGLDFLDASTIKGIKTNFNGNETLDVKVSIKDCQ